MTRTTLLVSAAVTASALALTACAGGGDDTATATDPAGTSADASAEPGTNAPPEPGADAPTDEGERSAADVMFVRMMIPHHEQAIEMSDIILAKSDIPADITALAEKIKAEQAPEIDQMTAWLDQWGQPPGPRDGHRGHGGGGMPVMGNDMSMMDGMLSADELQQLFDAEGTDAARLYLEQMIAHHEGAIDMAQGEVSDGTYQPTVALARSIIDTQQQEIARMREMLAAM
ncbi:DUF305 domain-containing protein [Dietzia kunjamensis]|uniref:DUF305 domain-containing protein n=1 Tax=Dietzia kunjamensis TaxID=322509 RepID=UPI002096F3C4|nr:DUF305 domain-containing protein [Dietzia kunjamensis]USX44777.1 DUF305 domain-containing protein [Dietzia kunjamensis]